MLFLQNKKAESLVLSASKNQMFDRKTSFIQTTRHMHMAHMHIVITVLRKTEFFINQTLLL
jgi:hypothetical protein